MATSTLGNAKQEAAIQELRTFIVGRSATEGTAPKEFHGLVIPLVGDKPVREYVVSPQTKVWRARSAEGFSAYLTDELQKIQVTIRRDGSCTSRSLIRDEIGRSRRSKSMSLAE